MNKPTVELLSLLKYRLDAVAIGHLALRHTLSWDTTPSIAIFFDDKQVIEGNATAFTNGAVEAAIIHSRALLEFLGIGLAANDATKLTELKKRRTDDFRVEQFSGLSKLSIKTATDAYPGGPKEAEASLAYVIYAANKCLAHSSSSFTKGDPAAGWLEIAFRGVATLLINNFYIPLEITPPNFELLFRKRSD